jgi:hypothetical protein
MIYKDLIVLHSASGQKLSLALNPATWLFYAHCFANPQQQANTLADSLHIVSGNNTNLMATGCNFFRSQPFVQEWKEGLICIYWICVLMIDAKICSCRRRGSIGGMHHLKFQIVDVIKLWCDGS